MVGLRFWPRSGIASRQLCLLSKNRIKTKNIIDTSTMKTIYSVIILAFCLLSCSDTTDHLVVISTPYGDIKVLLYDETPLHKENFLQLAKSGQYDSTIFHRVIQGFMVQGGDVNAVEGKTKITGTIPAEIVEGFIHHKGAVAAARMGDEVNPTKASSGCQFYIVQGVKYDEADLIVDQYKLNMAMRELLELPGYTALRDQIIMLQNTGDMRAVQQLALQYKDTVKLKLNVDVDRYVSPQQLEAYTTIGGAPHLDGEYTVFGRVVEGLDVVDAIAAQPTAGANKPIKNIGLAMRLEKMEKAMITEKYGYQYPAKQ